MKNVQFQGNWKDGNATVEMNLPVMFLKKTNIILLIFLCRLNIHV